jgi:hypothetical protein
VILFSRSIKIVASRHTCDDSLIKKGTQSGELILRKKGIFARKFGQVVGQATGQSREKDPLLI